MKKILFNQYIGTVVFNYLFIVINIIIGFTLIPLIVKNLGYESLGMFAVFFSLKSLLDIGIVWVSSGIVKLLINYKYLKNSIYTFTKIVNFIFGLFIFIFFIIYGYLNEGYLISSLLFGISNFILFLINPYYEVLIANLKQSQVAFFRFLQQTLFFIFSISFFLFYSKLSSIFVGMLLSNILIFFLIYFYYKKNYSLAFSLKYLKEICKRIFTREISIFINSLSTILLLQVDVLLISYLYGKASAGIYLIIFKIPNTLIMLGWRLSEPFQAIIAKGIKEDIKKIFLKFKKLEVFIFIVAVIFSFSYLLLGKYILELWVGKANIPNIKYMYIIPSIVVFFSIIQRLYLSVNYYTKNLNFVSILQFLEILSKVIFTIFFFHVFKELSPIVGWCFAFFFTIWLYRKNAYKVFKDI